MGIRANEVIKKIGSIMLVIVLSFTTVFTVRGEDMVLRQSQDVSSVLNDTMEQLAITVKEPNFGTNAGEWTVFSLARGEYMKKGHEYFEGYYERIVDTVNEIATNVDKNGALDKNKSTENSRLIVALSAIGKDATAVGNWDLVEAYSVNGINWIRKQGLNGTIWTLIALDSNNYATSDPTIRQQCVDAIISAQHNDKGWSLITNKVQPSNVDITCMALTALYPYREQPEVASACEEAIEWLSKEQLDTGGFPYGRSETSESCAWAIVALTTWGINPDTDTRFIKDNKSPVDNLLTYYVEADKMFAHQGKESNPMATDQACYALVAYQRFINGKTALFDYSDVTFGDEIPNMPTDPISDSVDENTMIIADKTNANNFVEVVESVSYSAMLLYTGDDVDLIPSTKKAIAVSVIGIENATKLTYNDGVNKYDFQYSREISNKTGSDTYIALVDASIDMIQFSNKSNFTFEEDKSKEITFGDSNGDSVINAQDALAAVDIWLRKKDAPTDDGILVLNVNGDSCINTFDALEIVEAFVNQKEYDVVVKMLALSEENK